MKMEQGQERGGEEWGRGMVRGEICDRREKGNKEMGKGDKGRKGEKGEDWDSSERGGIRGKKEEKMT